MSYVDTEDFKKKAGTVRLLMAGRKARLDRELRAIEEGHIREALLVPAESAHLPQEAIAAFISCMNGAPVRG